jgi:hypothetical protein
LYTTYAITDPLSRRFIYVGQTNDFERRKSEHLKPPRVRKTKFPKHSIKEWLSKAHSSNIKPLFTILEVVETEEQSLLSESHWIEKLSCAGQPLLNRWEEHIELIEQGREQTGQYYQAFIAGEWKKVIADIEPTKNLAGHNITFKEPIEFIKGDRLIMMPKRES